MLAPIIASAVPEALPGAGAGGGNPEEGAAGVDVRQHGIVANTPSAAETNTIALRTLLDPSKPGPAGRVVFPNSSGRDVYHFSGVIPIRDGTHLDLAGCTIKYSGAVAAGDVNSGLFFALRDFVCENGTIDVSCDTSAATGSGHAIQIGARGTDSSHFTVWDSQLPMPLGNIALRNLRLTVHNTGTHVAGSTAIGILGGVQNLIAENIVIEGNGSLPLGIYYEFGWATNEPQADRRQTSHAQNMRFINIVMRNLGTGAGGAGLTLGGAYDCVIDGLHVSSGATAFLAYPADSMFFRPWKGVDQAGVRHGIRLSNLVAESLASTAVALTGAQSSASAYLAGSLSKLEPTQKYAAESDLGDFVLDGFAIADCGGLGVITSGGRTVIRNGAIRACQRGIVATDECTSLTVQGVDVRGCQQHGMQLDIGAAVWNPPRAKKLLIQGCRVGGNSTAAAGKFAGIELGGSCDSATIEDCRLGLELAYDGIAETTQGDAILLNSTIASNVVCRDNHVGGAAGSAVAYHCMANGAASANGNTIERASGLVSASGNWLTDFVSAAAQQVNDGSTILTQNLRTVRVSATRASNGVILGRGYGRGQSVTILNEGASANSIAFAAADVSHVAEGQSSVIAGMSARTYVWDEATRLWYAGT